MTLPSVSVAVVTYQHGPFVGDLVRSALDQDYERLDVVVSDDGSTDGAQEILREMEREYPDRLTCIFNDGPRSVVANANRALAKCTGDLVCFVDGDDLFLPGKIAAQVEVFRNDVSVHVCHHPVETFDSGTGATLGVQDVVRGRNRLHAADLVAEANFIPTCSSMLRRSAMPAHGCRSELSCAPDWLLMIETARGGEIHRLEGVWARYRRHSGQITSDGVLESPVWRDALKTLDLVQRDYPDLAPFCSRGRANVLSWEAFRRLRGGHAPRHSVPLLARAVLHQPGNSHLWRAFAALSLQLVVPRPRRARPAGA